MPAQIELQANKALNNSIILNNDSWVFGNGSYRADFTELGEYTIYAEYSCKLAGSDIWTGVCISNRIVFNVVN